MTRWVSAFRSTYLQCKCVRLRLASDRVECNPGRPESPWTVSASSAGSKDLIIIIIILQRCSTARPDSAKRRQGREEWEERICVFLIKTRSCRGYNQGQAALPQGCSVRLDEGQQQGQVVLPQGLSDWATNRMRIRLSSHEGYLIGINSGISSRVEYHYLVGSCLSQSQV